MTLGRLIDGKAFAEALRTEIAAGVAHFARAAGRKPGLAVVLVGDDPASGIYVRSKHKACLEAGMESFEFKRPNSIAEDDILDLVEELRIGKEEARARLGLPAGRKLVVYTGKIYWGYREVDHILEAARRVAGEVEFVMVGGRADHIERYREYIAESGIANVSFVGFVPPSQVQYYQLAADLLLLYYPTGIALNRYRSPGKIFEYMASGEPMIVADYPVLREILGDDPAAVMVPPDSPDRLASAIEMVLADEELGRRLARRALERVKGFTWRKRAEQIINFIERRIGARQ